MAVSAHSAKPRFDVDKCGCQPAFPLARVLPMVDLGAAFLDQSIDGLETVGRLERAAEHGVDAESMQGQRLLEALRQAASCRLVSIFQLGVELLEGSQGLHAELEDRWSRRRQSACSLLGR